MLGRTIAEWVARAPRRRVGLPAVVHRNDGTAVPGQVSNVSYEGCHFLSEADIDVGESLILELPGRGTVTAQVRWREDVEYGLRFVLQVEGRDARRARIGV